MDSKRMNERGVASEFYERLRPTPIGVNGQVPLMGKKSFI